MKIKSVLRSAVSMALPVLLTLLVLSVHEAYAASCFTDAGGHWAETFICWMKTTGLSSGYPDGTFRPNNYITRAEVAALLYKEASGDTYVNIGPGAWQVNVGSGNAYIKYFTPYSLLRSLNTGPNHYQISIPIIAALHNQQMTVKAAEVCYDATATAGGSITEIYSALYDATGSLIEGIDDAVSHTDKTCRVYTFTTPYPLVSTDSLVIFVTTSLVTTSDSVIALGASAIQGFSPTAGVLAPSFSVPGPAPDAAP